MSLYKLFTQSGDEFGNFVCNLNLTFEILIQKNP